YGPDISFPVGIASWWTDMAIVLILSAGPVGGRVAVIVSGLFLAVPCFIPSSPLFRAVLMCVMFMPFFAAAALLLAPPIVEFRARLGFLCSLGGTHEVKRRARKCDLALLLQLVLATIVLATALAIVNAVPEVGLWLPVRWFAGGIAILAFAEMATAGVPFVSSIFGVTVPPLMRSPYQSTSIGEFWTRRWNFLASEVVFHPYCFAPLARHGTVLALFAVFALSAVGHALLAFMALGRWRISLICGAFFLVQPLFIIAERRLAVRRWPPAAGWTWTWTVLMITSPLFVETVIQVIKNSWGKPESVLPPTLVVLVFVMVFSGSFSIASLVACSGGSNRKAAVV
ncbi:MAG TPA: MBOAT family protein, partial [Verrucomicrobiae bacterium]|nr:MBOAT family protein [Verrucomicrobiae bacterium]